MARRLIAAACLAAAASAPALDAERFVRTVVVPVCEDPMQLDFAPDGTLFWIERQGAVKWRSPAGDTGLAGRVRTLAEADAGALGLVLARDFAASRQIIVYYCPADPPRSMRVERLTLEADRTIIAGSARVLLEVPMEPGDRPAHCGGGLAWDRDGNLLVGTGDNSPPQDVPAVHPDERQRDSRRSAANPHDLRGKILRFRPLPDGTLSIPPGNLFTDPAAGRPEVFAMGVRNPFRIHCDPQTGWVTWGDVGGNVRTDLGLGPEGFDEINLTSTAGFFGWPFCSGNNAPWRPFDGRTLKPAGPFWDPQRIVNDSPALTKPVVLPPARPALIWYGSAPSAEWPFFGSGGRSVTGGLIWRRPREAAPDALPAELDGSLIFGEWMRNWLARAELRPDGKLGTVEPFLGHLTFRRPVHLAAGPDGALWIAEMGDRWSGNTDSTISRISWQAGNRPPRPSMTLSASAGPCPLTVRADASASRDPDAGDTLTFTWQWQAAGRSGTATGPTPTFTFTEPGDHVITLTVRDAAGAEARTQARVAAGNAPPRVAFTGPADGGFFEWGKPLPWNVQADDPEDGAAVAETLLVRMERRDRPPAAAADHPGLALMRGTTCFSCHRTADPSAGPPYAEVARRHAADPDARGRLARKILSGGAGAWGEIPMPPHPQHSPAEAGLMVDWILSLARQGETQTARGTSGRFTPSQPPSRWGMATNGVLTLTAETADRGAAGLPPLHASASITLRNRRQRASFFDAGARAVVQDNLDQGGLVARLTPGGHLRFRHLRFQDIGTVRLHGWAHGAPVRVTLHRGSPESPALAELTLPAGPAGGRPAEWRLTLPRQDPDAPPADFCLAAAGDGIVDLMWVDFDAP